MKDRILRQTLLKEQEKGVSNDPDDRGGLTNDGITYKHYVANARTVLGINPTEQHFRTMTQAEILRFYDRIYNRLGLNQVNSPKVAAVCFDFAFNSGFGKREIQEVLVHLGYPVATDNIFGPRTIDALNRAYSQFGDVLIDAILAHRITYIKDLVFDNISQAKFIKGWMNRIVDLRRFTFEVLA